MKQILFIIPDFKHGGTNKSLENLLAIINSNKYQISIFAMGHYGPYSKMLNNCIILEKDKWINALISRTKSTNTITKIRNLFIRIFSRLLFLINIDLIDFLYKKAVLKISHQKLYNTVIAFEEGPATALARYFNVSNKIAWVRCDYSNYLKMNNNLDEKNIYKTYNTIFCVSEYTKNIFVKIFPEYNNKTFALHNIINARFIKESSMKGSVETEFENNIFNILSVGRFYRTKRFSLIPDIAQKLIEFGCEFRWYIIGGDGHKDESEIFDEKIRKYKLDNIIRLGEKNNPYPYIKNCDLLVSTSFTEACPNVINEAKILHTPVVTTNFGSSIEFIDNNINGKISSVENLAYNINILIKDKNEYNRLKNNISEFEYSNEFILDKIENSL